MDLYQILYVDNNAMHCFHYITLHLMANVANYGSDSHKINCGSYVNVVFCVYGHHFWNCDVCVKHDNYSKIFGLVDEKTRMMI